MDLKSTYNRIAEDWNKDHEKDTWWIPGAEKFASYFKKGESILDVGCAGGLKTEYLTNQGFVVDGIDFSEKMIKVAQKRMPRRFFLVRDINEPLRLKSKYDGIIAQAVLLHIPKKYIRKVIQNLLEVLKPGGYIYVSVKKANERQIEEQIIKENDYGYEYERFFSFYTLDEMIGYFKELRLNIVYSDVTSSGKTDWIQVIAQKQ